MLAAVGQLGQREEPKGSNRGPMVNEYLRSVGLNPGYAWCQAFVHWCYGEAADMLLMENPVVKTAGVLDCWNRTAVNFKITAAQAKASPEQVRVGSQIVWKHGKITGHTGIVEAVAKNVGGQWVIRTIEGNTNDEGSREGYEVARRERVFTDPHLLGFIQY